MLKKVKNHVPDTDLEKLASIAERKISKISEKIDSYTFFSENLEEDEKENTNTENIPQKEQISHVKNTPTQSHIEQSLTRLPIKLENVYTENENLRLKLAEKCMENEDLKQENKKIESDCQNKEKLYSKMTKSLEQMDLRNKKLLDEKSEFLKRIADLELKYS
ncbi:MAG: hypothetical protein MHPSP_002075, partial [Paramarteilia canceri]